jgi:membrane associated rhomboid family serine protease
MGNRAPSELQIVFHAAHRRATLEASLVLESAGIWSQVVQRGGEWTVMVAAADFDLARQELASYARDNPIAPAPEPTPVQPRGGAAIGVFVYAILLVSIAVVSAGPDSQAIWESIGRMNASQIRAGQWWRTTTALTLHADALHLLSNLAFGALFGFLSGRILGGGLAWLTIIAAGSLGNLLNGLLRDSQHSSIGASTAVFAALGILVAHALRPRKSLSEHPFRRWSPLIGGVLLLAMTGVGGERTDVGAHVAGFVCGLILGWVAARLPAGWLSKTVFQISAGLAAVTIVIFAWSVAIANS